MTTKYKVEGVEEMNPKKFGGMVSRAVSLPQERKGIDFSKGIETVATTEAAAMVVDWERWEVVREILPMKFMEAPTGDKVPFLDSHNRSSLERVKGSARNFRVDGDKLMATVFISETEKELQQKIREGHVDSVSIGYMTDSDQTVEVPKGKSVVIDGQAFRNDHTDGVPMLVRLWWKTHELSGVAIGADEAAKFKSEAQDKHYIQKITELQKDIEEIKKNIPPKKEERAGMSYVEYRLRMIEHENKTK
jgi:hypothetical protein